MTPRETANQAMASLHQNSLSQMMQMHQPSPPMLGCNHSNQLDVFPLQLLPNSVGHGVSAENSYLQRQLAAYQGQTMMAKNVTDAQSNEMFLNALQQQQCPNCFEPGPQPSAVLSPGSLMAANVGIPGCPTSNPGLQQVLSTNMGSLDGFDLGRQFIPGSFNLEEKQSSNDKSSGSSSRSICGRQRWRPNDHQLEILERYSESGGTRATPELHAAIQGCGHATESNVTVWLKNRASRRRKPTGKHTKIPYVQEAENGVDIPLDDFTLASRTVMHELTGVISGVRRSDALYLARAIQEAQHICCYGVGKGALVMKGFGAGLHHLGYDAFFVDDTNVPHFDNKSLALINAGPGSGNRVYGMIDDMRSAGSHIIVFSTYRMEDSNRPSLHTILIPCHSRSPLQLGSDSEVMSGIPEPPQEALLPGTLFDLSLTLLCECVCVMLRRAGDITPAEIRARHTNLE